MISPSALENVEIAVAVGKQARQTLSSLATALKKPAPTVPDDGLSPGEGMVWCIKSEVDPFIVKLREAKSERRRHLRKYAQGELGPDRSFYFRGPEGKLNLRAQNLRANHAHLRAEPQQPPCNMRRLLWR